MRRGGSGPGGQELAQGPGRAWGSWHTGGLFRKKVPWSWPPGWARATGLTGLRALEGGLRPGSAAVRLPLEALTPAESLPAGWGRSWSQSSPWRGWWCSWPNPWAFRLRPGDGCSRCCEGPGGGGHVVDLLQPWQRVTAGAPGVGHLPQDTGTERSANGGEVC